MRGYVGYIGFAAGGRYDISSALLQIVTVSMRYAVAEYIQCRTLSREMPRDSNFFLKYLYAQHSRNSAYLCTLKHFALFFVEAVKSSVLF